MSPLLVLPKAETRLKNLLKHLLGLPDDAGTLIFAKTKRLRPGPTIVEALRGTQFIGVTKNASRFQAMVTVEHLKRYIGTYESAEEAARAFDKHSMWFRGMKVKKKCKWSM